MTTTTMTESSYESTQTTVQSTFEPSQSTESSPTTTEDSESTTTGRKTLVFACAEYKAFCLFHRLENRKLYHNYVEYMYVVLYLF